MLYRGTITAMIRVLAEPWLTRLVLGAAGAALIAAAVLLWAAIQEAPDETLTVAFLDVGQGDAIYIEAPNGRQMLIDGGPSRQVLRELGAMTPWYDRSIDVVLATHPDKDHISGLVDVLDQYRVGAVLVGGARSDTGLYTSWKRRRASDARTVHRVHAGQSVRISPRVHFDVLFPPRPAAPARMDRNSASVVGRLVYGDTAFLLSGDVPKAIERYLARRYGTHLESDVLKVGHHGSDTSSAPAWIGWSDPAYAVISAGKDNRHGHPHTQVVKRLKRFGANVVQTKQRGTVVFESDGEQVRLLE